MGGKIRPENTRGVVRLGLTAVASPLEVGAGDAPLLIARLKDAFSKAYGGRVQVCAAVPAIDPDSAVSAGRALYDQRVDAICVISASWFEDYLVIDLLEECDVPVIAWARPGMETGALCGMQQLGFMLKTLEKPYLVLFGAPEDSASLARAWDFASVAGLRAGLRRARIGYLGHRVEGMTETTAHELALKKLLGPRVVGIDSQQFLERAAAASPAMAQSLWDSLKPRAGRVSASEEAGIHAMQVYEALRDTVDELGLSAMAVGCYPHLMGKVCLPISLLADEGVPIACEGDINNAVSMLLLQRLTGEPVHNTDLLDPIPTENSIVFSHCGNGSFSLAESRESITLAPVRLVNSGVCATFPSRPGTITLVNLAATLSGYRMGVLFGRAVPTDMVFPGNPLRVQFAADYGDILTWIANQGLGHHWMGAYGDVRRPLGDYAKMTGCEILNMA